MRAHRTHTPHPSLLLTRLSQFHIPALFILPSFITFTNPLNFTTKIAFLFLYLNIYFFNVIVCVKKQHCPPCFQLKKVLSCFLSIPVGVSVFGSKKVLCCECKSWLGSLLSGPGKGCLYKQQQRQWQVRLVLWLMCIQLRRACVSACVWERVCKWVSEDIFVLKTQR